MILSMMPAKVGVLDFTELDFALGGVLLNER